MSQTSLESVSQTSLDPFAVDLREFGNEKGVIRAVQFFFMEENEPREPIEEVTLSVIAIRVTADTDDCYLQDEERWFPVVVDSGADAAALPSEMLTEVGQPPQENPHPLHDAQRTKIEVKGLRDVCFIVQTEEGREVYRYMKGPTLQTKFGNPSCRWGDCGNVLGHRSEFPWRCSARA